MLSGSSQIHLKRLAKLVYDTMLVYVDFPFFFPMFCPLQFSQWQDEVGALGVVVLLEGRTFHVNHV